MQAVAEKQRTLWFDYEDGSLKVIDQTLLPFQFKVLALNTLADAVDAIVTMKVRGAPLIGITAAFGVYLSLRSDMHSLNTGQSALGTRAHALCIGTGV